MRRVVRGGREQADLRRIVLSWLVAEGAKDLVPENECTAEVRIGLGAFGGVVPAVQFVGAEDVVGPAAAQVQVGVLEHQHRLGQREIGKDGLCLEGQQHGREHRHSEIDDVAERAIRQHIELNNANPKPFVWSKTADDILASIGRFCVRISDLGH